jgi:hypothetical protein
MAGVRIQFTYARGPDHFAEHPSAPVRAPSPVPSYVIAALLALAGVAFAVAALIYRAPQTASCGACGALLGVLIAVAARQRGKGRFVMPPAAMEPRRWVISETGIEIGHDTGSAAATWPAFRHALELPHAYLFVMKDRDDKRTFDIPREPLAEADDTAVRDVIARHGITLYPRPKVP